MKIARQIVAIATLIVAAFTSFWDGVGLLFAGTGSFGNAALFLVPALALPLAILAYWKPVPATAIFITGYICNVAYQVRIFGTTFRQLLTNATGFIELSLTAILLLSLVVIDGLSVYGVPSHDNSAQT